MVDFIKLYLGTTRRLAYTFTTSFFNPTERKRLMDLYNVYNHNNDPHAFPIDPYIIPKTDVLAINGNDQAIYEGVDECGFGHITEFELKVICQIIQKYQPQRVFEIGTFEGRTTLNIALNAPNAQIFTLDLPAADLGNTKMQIEKTEEAYVKKTQSGGRFLNHPAKKNIQQLFGDSATFDFSPYYNSIDLMFVDGSHAYEYVLSDTDRALKLVKKGGIILWHDYTNWEGVRDALNEFYKNDPLFKGVKHIGGTSIVMLQV
ncbi:class I SAM-dependent methyltransferase [Runella zeae]|uniref:class I SAM-dependent methyltransferase n=1 Tax=Runella zeae TaxID=94255 RepID=UPI00048D51FB|nr:class I SAM-dependent methyltransferase [Runella zeae]